jgi:membrane protein HdeD
MVSAGSRVDRWIAAVFGACLLGACATHIRDVLRHGWLPYRFAPLPLNAYWTCLTFLDILAAIRLFCSFRVGLLFALLMIVSDVVVNSFAILGLRLHLQPLPLLLQFLFLIAIIAATVYIQRRGGVFAAAKR